MSTQRVSSKSDKKKNISVQEVLGVAEVNGKICYLVKVKGEDEPVLYESAELQTICPQLIIAFFQARTKLVSLSDLKQLRRKTRAKPKPMRPPAPRVVRYNGMYMTPGPFGKLIDNQRRTVQLLQEHPLSCFTTSQ